MATIGKLAVQITADTQGLKTGLNDAVSDTDRASKDMVNSIKAIGAAFAAVISVDMFKNMVVGAAEASRQIDQLSRLSATSTANFQAQAYAAQQFGISSEKLADIFKDVQDKVGDFIQNGAGPLADFFKNIAPQVGVTADQFRNLGGPEALQLYVSSLERANLSQSEMTFYLEAIASDSALLLPLLQNNGKAMKDLGDEAQRLGVILDQETIEANKEFAAQLDRLNALSTSLSRTIGSALIPEINRLINEMVTGIETAGGFWKALSVFGTINPFKDLQGNLKSTREEIDTLTAAKERYVKAGSDTSGIDQALATEKLRLEYLQSIERQQIANQQGSGDNQSAAEARRLGLSAPTSTRSATPAGTPAPAAAAASTDALDEWFENNQKKQDKLDEREREYWASRVQRIEEGLMSETELLNHKHQADLERLDAAVMSEDERRLIRESLEMEHLDRMTDIEEQGRALRVKAESDAAAEIERIRLASMTKLEKFTAMSYQDQAMAVGKAMSDQLTSVSTNSRAMFNIQKAANISQAIMDTYAGANRALKDYPAPWSYAVAGATLAAGLSRVASIKSQTFGGATAAGGGTAATGGVAATSGMAQQAGGGGGGGMNQSITVQGIGADSLFSGDAVRTLIDRLIDAQRNGARIVLA